MPASDGLLAPLRAAPQAAAVGALSRGTAALALAVLYLPALVATARRRARGLGPRWQVLPVVTGQDEAVGEAQVQMLHVLGAVAGPCGPSSWLDAVGPLRDVVRGRRAWLGRRPLGAAQWASLSEEWRALLAKVPVGVFHAAAWHLEAPAAHRGEWSADETELAADLYLAAQPDPGARRQCLWAALPRTQPAAPSGPTAVAPPPVWRSEAAPRRSAPASGATATASEAKPVMSSLP
jgi:hypothetical protein